jgi:hypothetical protein
MQPHVKNPPFGGFGLAVNRSPSFERFVIFGFPIRQLWENCNVRLHIEAEIRPVLEHDADGVSALRRHEFDAFNDLAFDFREGGSFASLARTCNFIVSHCRLSLEGALVRTRSVLDTSGASVLLYRGVSEGEQAKSDLPNNSAACPIKQLSRVVIGQSHSLYQTWQLWEMKRTGKWCSCDNTK